VDRRTFMQGAAFLAAAGALPIRAEGLEMVTVQVDTANIVGPLPHVWEECVGSDRAAITLRDDWRQDLIRWHTEAGLKRVRFHGIFNDELGVDAPSILSRGVAQLNFQNIDRVYDGLLARGVSPYVELSFMPKKLVSADRKFGFYGGNSSPPASLEDWAGFIKAFLAHLIDRYGLAAVKTWPFEVWNEPNLGFFWSGTQQQYFDFYKATALAVKSVDDSLQVGGPSTARAEWIGEFASYAGGNNVPVDFFSTHTYAGDSLKQLFGDAHYAAADVIPEAMRRVREQIDAGAFRGRPLWLSEWSSDSPAMILHVIAGCMPHVKAMSQWALSATFEELGVADYLLKEGYGGWGTMAQGIAQPSFNTYKLLHALGGERLEAQGPALASRRPDRSVAVASWDSRRRPHSNRERLGETVSA
jgi:xylan 1,4-beta-xylosidase